MGALRLRLAAFGLADATVAADLPYADAARFAEPAVRYDTPGLRSGRDNFSCIDELLEVRSSA